jgi:hypothetical protein
VVVATAFDIEAYLHYEHYPFYFQGVSDYHLKLEIMINKILDVDLPLMLEINIHKGRSKNSFS